MSDRSAVTFAPLFVAGNEWDVYAPRGVGQLLETTLAGQMEYTYFPVTLDQLSATIRYHDLAEGIFLAGGVQVVSRYLNHPAIALGYRLDANGVVVVYATDHEPHSAHQPSPARQDSTPTMPVHHEDQRHIDFLSGADLVIHDAQYTAAEYPTKMTWGHTSAEQAVDFALAAGAHRLALFHHDPLRDDAAIDRLVEVCRGRAAGSELEIFAAAEGQLIEVHSSGPSPRRGSASPTGAKAAGPLSATILIVDDDPEVISLLSETLAPAGFRLLFALDGDTALTIARTERPDLVLLDWSMPGRDGLAVCRALRAEPDPRVREVPVVLLTARTGAEETASGFAAGATDYMVKPFKPTHVRSRVEAWLIRHREGSP